MEIVEPPKSRLYSRAYASRYTQSKRDVTEYLYEQSLPHKSQQIPFLSFIDPDAALYGSVFCLTQGYGVSSEQMYIQAASDALNILEKHDSSATFIIKQVLDYLYVYSYLKPEELEYLRRNVRDLYEDNDILRERTEDMEVKKTYYYQESQVMKQRLLKSEDLLAKAYLENQYLATQREEQEEKLISLYRCIAEMSQETQASKHNFNISATRYTKMTGEMTKLRSQLEEARATIHRKDAQLAYEADLQKASRQEIDKLNNQIVLEGEKKRNLIAEHAEDMSKMAYQLIAADYKCIDLEEKLQKEQKRFLNAQVQLQSYYARANAYYGDTAYTAATRGFELSSQEQMYVALYREVSVSRLPRGSLASAVKEQMQYQTSTTNLHTVETRDAKVQVNTLFSRDRNYLVAVDQQAMDKYPIEKTIEYLAQTTQFENVMEFSDYQDFTEINASAHKYEECFGNNQDLKLTNTDMTAVKQYIQQYFVPKQVVEDLKYQFYAINCKYAKYKVMFYQLEMERNLSELKGRYDSMQYSIYNLNQIMLKIPDILDEGAYDLMLQINDMKYTYIRDMMRNEQRFFEFERVFLQAKQVALEFYYYSYQAENNKFIRLAERKYLTKEILSYSMMQLFETLKQFQRLPQLYHIKVSQFVRELLPDQRNQYQAKFRVKQPPALVKNNSLKINNTLVYASKLSHSPSGKLSHNRNSRLKPSKTAKFIVGQTSLADLLKQQSNSQSDTGTQEYGQFLSETPAYQKPVLMGYLASLCETVDIPERFVSLNSVPPLMVESLKTITEQHTLDTATTREQWHAGIDEEVMTILTGDYIAQLLTKSRAKEIQPQNSCRATDDSAPSDAIERLGVAPSNDNVSKVFEWYQFVYGQTQYAKHFIPKLDDIQSESISRNNSAAALAHQKSVKAEQFHEQENYFAAILSSNGDAATCLVDITNADAVVNDQSESGGSAHVRYFAGSLYKSGAKSDAFEPRFDKSVSCAILTEDTSQVIGTIQADAAALNNTYVYTDNDTVTELARPSDSLAKQPVSVAGNASAGIPANVSYSVIISEYKAPAIENLQKPLERKPSVAMRINTLKDIQNFEKSYTTTASYTAQQLTQEFAAQATPAMSMENVQTDYYAAFPKQTQTETTADCLQTTEIAWKQLTQKKQLPPVLENNKYTQRAPTPRYFDTLDRQILLNKPKDHCVVLDPEVLIRDEKMDREIAKLSSRGQTIVSEASSPPQELESVEPVMPMPTAEAPPQRNSQIPEIQKIIDMIDSSSIIFGAPERDSKYYDKENPRIIIKTQQRDTKSGTRQSPRRSYKIQIAESPERYRMADRKTVTSSVTYSKSLLDEERKQAFAQYSIGEVFRILINNAPKQYAIENGRFISPFEKVISYRRQLMYLKRLYYKRQHDQQIIRALDISYRESRRNEELVAIRYMESYFEKEQTAQKQLELMQKSILFANATLRCPLFDQPQAVFEVLVRVQENCNITILTPIALRNLNKDSVQIKQAPYPNDYVYWILHTQVFAAIIGIAYSYCRYLSRQIADSSLSFIQLPPSIYLKPVQWLIRVIRTVYYEMHPSENPTVSFSEQFGQYLLGKYGIKQMAARFIWQLLANIYVYYVEKTVLHEVQTFMLFLSNYLDAKCYSYFWYCRKLLLPDAVNPQTVTVQTATQLNKCDKATQLQRLRTFLPNLLDSYVNENVDASLLYILAGFCERRRKLTAHIAGLFERIAKNGIASTESVLALLQKVNTQIDECALTQLSGGKDIDLGMFCRLYETVITPTTTAGRVSYVRAKIEKAREVILLKRINGLDQRLNAVHMLLYNGQYLDAEIQIDYLYDEVIIY